jgi:hypothetical protein
MAELISCALFLCVKRGKKASQHGRGANATPQRVGFASPGQRPGEASGEALALKGQNRPGEAVLDGGQWRLFKARHNVAVFFSRALPFADECCPVAFSGTLNNCTITGNSADFMDADGDGLNNWAEWLSGTNPTNALSVLRLAAPSFSAGQVSVRWQSVAGVSYFLERSTNLAAQSSFVIIATNILGQANATNYVASNAVGAARGFYRIGVKR